MKSIIYQFSFLIILAIGISSCSSDPCEAVPCVNGSCNEGICDCAPGFKGAACDEIDYNFVGEFRSTMLSRLGCPSASDNLTLSTNTENQICSTVGNRTTCLEVLLRIESDNTFFLNVITVIMEGSLTLGDPTVIRGTYTESGNVLTLCDEFNDCQTITMDMTQTSYQWQQVVPQNNECGFEWTLTRQ